uniref:Solute carrier family 15 member 2 n=1 Tax=Denticeps clupeoides TaxID=299321 RepID=A0AAY4BVV4_9TELE
MKTIHFLFLSVYTSETANKDVMLELIKLCGTNYPLSIGFIVVNEFCERFSYYGMKALLTLYFIHYLHWDKNLSTAVYHAFSSLCYFTPVLGALIADSWLGKFWTITYLSILYVIGHVVKSVGAIPDVGDSTVHTVLSMLGLILIAFGTGGIKPCVAAFGGDQFEEEHTEERRKFFSIFYMSINAGSVLSTVITPILRGDVQCFGGDCYALAFGVPAALMVVALVVFVCGSGLYKKSPPEGNVMLRMFRCVGFAIGNRSKNSKHNSKREHWLDWAEEKYPKHLIQEIKMVMRVLVLYIPLPMFWALFEQQGSRWTLQATRMNMDLGGFVLKPDQMQMLNALLILVFIPIFDLGVYPLIGLCRIKLTPLRKMATGMIIAALAFGAATVVELNVIKTVVAPPLAKESLLQVVNLADRDVKVSIQGQEDIFPHPIKPYEVSSTSQWVILFINTRNEDLNITVGNVEFFVPANFGMSTGKAVERQQYTNVICRSSSEDYSIDLGLLDFGASYTVILRGVSANEQAVMEDVQANNINIAWQIPQYVLITAGEVMFSITGLEFSYSQAPASMKSVLQAGWLMTVAFGNVIVLIVAEGAGLQQWTEFLLFGGLLVAVCIIFSIMAYFYNYVNPDQLGKDNDDEEHKDLKKDNPEMMYMTAFEAPKPTKM